MTLPVTGDGGAADVFTVAFMTAGSFTVAGFFSTFLVDLAFVLFCATDVFSPLVHIQIATPTAMIPVRTRINLAMFVLDDASGRKAGFPLLFAPLLAHPSMTLIGTMLRFLHFAKQSERFAASMVSETTEPLGALYFTVNVIWNIFLVI